MAADTSLQHRSRPLDATDARQLRTRKVLRSALLALLERKQLAQISVRDIVAEAGIGYATFFRHHASKEELLDEIAAEQIEHLMSLALPLLDARNTRASCLALCQYVGEHRALWSALLTGGAAGTLRAEFIRLAKGGVGKVRSSGWLPVELGAVYGVGATIEILTWWLQRPASEYSAERVAEFVDRLVVAPSTASARRDAPTRALRSTSRSRKNPS
jgi:AcrR family transcriptional regulator